MVFGESQKFTKQLEIPNKKLDGHFAEVLRLKHEHDADRAFFNLKKREIEALAGIDRAKKRKAEALKQQEYEWLTEVIQDTVKSLDLDNMITVPTGSLGYLSIDTRYIRYSGSDFF